MCQMRNVPFYRNCSKCWALRPHWLPDANLPSSTSSNNTPLPAEPCGTQHGYYAASSESNDEQLGSSQGSLRQRLGAGRVCRRRIEVVSASSSDRNSESLASLSEEEDEEAAPSTSTGGGRGEDSRVSSATLPSSQEAEEGGGGGGLPRSEPSLAGGCRERGGGGKWRKGGGKDSVAPSSDVCIVCASRPKTGCIVHGSSGHQVCCYRCAKRLKRKGLSCPVCRRPIQKVIKNFLL